SRRRHTRWPRDWSSDVCSSDLEIRARQLCVDSQGFFQRSARARGVAFLQKHAADVGPAVGILGVGHGDFFESGGGAFQIALQKETDAVIIPASPFFPDADRHRLWRWRIVREN